MLLVRTRLGISYIHGIGLFADQPIGKDDVIWRFEPVIDIRLSEAQISELSLACQEQIRKYTYREKHSGLYVLCGDDARFFNHAPQPNCYDVYTGEKEDVTIALRDIRPGEELTCDYTLFDQDLVDGKYAV